MSDKIGATAERLNNLDHDNADLVKRLDALGGRGRDLSKSQVQGWVESVEREPVSSP